MKRIDKYIEKNIKDVTNKNIVITGANSGIGFESMMVLAKKGANVIMACRSLKRAQNAKDKVLKEYPNALIDIIEYDQSSFESIDNFINNLFKKYSKIDVLVCNAGIFHPEKGLKTKDGYPLTIGTNYIGLFYLLENIKNRLGNTKIIIVSSVVYRYTKYKDYKFLLEENTSVFNQYKLSKTAITNYFYYLSQNTNLNIYMMHPGVSSTNIFSNPNVSYWKWFKSLAKWVMSVVVHSPKKAALGISLLASKDYPNHTFLGPRGIGQISGYPKVIKLKNSGKKYANELYINTKKAIEGGNKYAKCE